MSVHVELKKPEHRKEELWRQHLQWWEVMSKQVDENLAHYQKYPARKSVKPR